MDSEKDLLRKDLENQDTPEKVNKFVEDAELLGHEDIAELGRQKLSELEAKSGEVSKTSESKISQINEHGGNLGEVEKRTAEVDKKIEEVKEEAKSEIEAIEKDGEIKDVKKDNFNNLILNKREDIKNFKKRMEIISSRLGNIRKSEEPLKGYLNKLVRKSSLGSETGGDNWELVEETQKLRELELQQKARMTQLKNNGKTWAESRADSEVREIEKQMDSLITEGVSQKFGYSNPGEGIIYLKGPSGDIGRDGVMTLKEALDSSIKYHEGIIAEYENKISENEKEIDKLQMENVKQIKDVENNDKVNEKLETLIDNYNQIKSGILKNWEEYTANGELEKLPEFLSVIESIKNLSSYNISKDDGPDSWRVVVSKIHNFNNLVDDKANEFEKPLEGLKQEIIFSMANLQNDDSYSQKLANTIDHSGKILNRETTGPQKKLLSLYQERVRELQGHK